MKQWIDPPSGWRYGFPKVWDPELDTDISKWLIDSGLPESELEFALNYLRCWNAE